MPIGLGSALALGAGTDLVGKTMQGGGSFWGNMGEMLGINNNWSSAGKARIEAQKARDFQERMDSTKYQRTIADMEKAGLNPLLTMMNGQLAPGGTMASTPGEVAQGSSNQGSIRDMIDNLTSAQKTIDTSKINTIKTAAMNHVKNFDKLPFDRQLDVMSKLSQML